MIRIWLKKEPEDYVISTGKSHSVKEFLTLATEHIGLGDWHNFVEIDEEKMRPTDIEDLVGDSSKARKKLGWTPKVNFEQLLKMMVDHDLSYVKSGG